MALGPDGHVYVADTWNHRIQVFNADGTFLTQWGTFGQTSDASNLMYRPRDVAVDATGRVFVTDTGNKRVLVYDRDGRLLAQWGGAGSFGQPTGIAVDPNGFIVVADTGGQRIVKVEPLPKDQGGEP